MGWSAGVASTVYFTHLSVIAFWWIYGLRRVPWRSLLAATGLALGTGLLWEAYGHAVAGLAFATDNSSLVGTAARRWMGFIGAPWAELIAFLRASNVSGTVLGAFPLPWWLFAGAGFLASSREDREWALAIIVAGLVPAIAMLAILPLPRVAYFMFPAVSFLAARGALTVAAGATRWLPGPTAGKAAAGVAAACLGLLALQGNADLFGYQAWNAQFHHALRLGW
jgi:hypothetical protein